MNRGPVPVMAAFLVAALFPGCGPVSEQPVRKSTMTVLVDCCAANQMRLHNLKHLLFLPLIERATPASGR